MVYKIGSKAIYEAGVARTQARRDYYYTAQGDKTKDTRPAVVAVVAGKIRAHQVRA
jgi:hypothetical protein